MRYILKCSTKCFSGLFSVYTTSKIRKFDIVILVEKQILEFDISMNDISLMKVINSCQQLIGEFSNLPLSQPFSLNLDFD